MEYSSLLICAFTACCMASLSIIMRVPKKKKVECRGSKVARQKECTSGLRPLTFDTRPNWARLELNQHALAGTRPSTLRVCQFRHEPVSPSLPAKSMAFKEAKLSPSRCSRANSSRGTAGLHLLLNDGCVV